MRHLLTSLLICLAFVAPSQTYTVESVPNTKLVNNSYVSNPDNILTETTVSEINSILGTLEANNSTQVAVVVIQSIGDNDIFDFAQKLFNTWGIGQQKENNGLLILMVMDKRTIRLHTGYGLEGDLPDIVCKHIETRKMVPYFKQEDYNAGILEGVKEVANIIGDVDYGNALRHDLSATNSDTDNNNNSDGGNSSHEFMVFFTIAWPIVMIILFLYNRSKGIFTDSPKFQVTHGPSTKTGSIHFLFWLIIIPVAIMLATLLLNQLWIFIVAFYGYLALSATETRMRLNSTYNKYFQQKDYYGLHQLYQDKYSFWKMVAIFIPIPFAFLWVPYKRRMRFLREHPRDCGQCHQPATKLSEQTEDPFLNEKQKLEENIKSIDYDVWKCNACGAVQVYRYPVPGTKYAECPKCETVAYYVASTRTIRSATTSHEGLKEEVKLCKFCKFRNVRTYTIPKESSDSGGSGSSSGGSWGGGSSGGGGASSSW